MKEINFRCKIYLLVASLFIPGCATPTLRPSDLAATEQLAEQGRVILLSSMQKRDPQNLWSGLKMMKVIATDFWSSPTARYFSPVPEASQQIQFAFNLLDEDAAAKFLGDRSTGNIFGIADGKTYSVTQGIRRDKMSKKVLGYLPVARAYFLWPQVMQNYKSTAYLGQAKKGYAFYYKIFVGMEESGGDEYIVWVNIQTLTIDYIQFSFRGLAKTHRGVVQYGDYRPVDGMVLPHEITLLENMDRKEFSHKFYAEVYSLE